MAAPDPVDTPPPTGGPPDLDRRVTRLETRFEPVDKTLDAIQAEQRAMREDIRGIRSTLTTVQQSMAEMQGALARLPTTSVLWGMIATVLAVGIALAGLTFTVANWAASAA